MKLVRPNSELETEEKAALEKEEQAKSPVMSMLAGYIQNAFNAAEMHRESSNITKRLTESRRLKSGIYDPAKLAQIRSVGSSELFYNITEPKCEAFVAWMTDVFNSAGDTPWGIDPTPIPSLSENETKAVVEEVVARFSEPGMEIDPEVIQQFTNELYDETLKLKIEKAKEKCERMARKIEDQTKEGGFLDALSSFFSDLSTYPSAILKGPVFHKHKRLKWDEQSKTVAPVEETIPTWYCPDPFNFYPGPNARNVNESYLCEVIDFDRGDLSNMRGLPGWKTEAIEKALMNNTVSSGAGTREDAPGESEMRTYENRETLELSDAPDATIRAIEFWGKVQGQMLLDWGMSKEKIKDPLKFYEVNCILINGCVVRTVMNPDPLGKRPYYVCSFVKNRNSLWGLASIPEKMKDCQDGVNVCQRNLLNNLAFGAGPQVAVDIDALPPNQVPLVNQQYPMKVWPFNGTKSPGARQPVTFFQPETNASELIQTAEFYEKKSDDRTGIPRYVTGDQDMSGAAATASGLSMLMNASAREIKRVIRNVDRDVIRPAIEAMFVYNMLHEKDDSLKGDAQILPRGAVAMLVKEQTQLRRQEFLNMTNNPTDMEIIGMMGRANVLREIARGLDMPEDKVVPPEDELRARVQQQMMQAQEMEPPQEPPQEPAEEMTA